jgi:protein TonB
MTVPVDGFFLGPGIVATHPPTARRWLRPAVQWLVVATAHASVLAAVLHMSPQARLAPGEVVQASLIVPPAPLQVRPPEPPRPPQPSPPRPQPPKPAPVLAAAPTVEPAPASFVVPAPPTDPVPADPAPAPVDSAPVDPSPAPAPVAAAAPPLIPPVFHADYLENPSPHYPPTSRRLGETGRVLLRVFVSADGRAERVEVRTSSGFERLDDAAREAVARWRFVPAHRGEERVAAWVQVPIVFVM